MRVRPIAGLVVVAAVTAGCSSGGSSPKAAATTNASPASHVQRPMRLVARPALSLSAPLQDAAAAPIGGSSLLLLGGLDSLAQSVDGIRAIVGAREVARGTLPGALHDAAAARVRDAVYLFGGGNGTSQLDTIFRVEPKTGAVRTAGRLPAASSDVGAASIGDTAYVVGGYTGLRWLDTIIAWRPGAAAHVVARLPIPLRYAAVAADGDELVIAGGSTPAGTASRAVYSFDPRTRVVTRIGSLPAPTTHASAAALQGVIYVIGGRGAARDTPVRRIVAVEPEARTVRSAGKLGSPRSDLAAVSVGNAIVVAGGRGPGGPVAVVDRLVPQSAAHASGAQSGASVRKARTVKTTAVTNVYAHDAAGMLSPVARRARPLVYVPNSDSNTVQEIDPRTFRVVRTFSVGALPQHVTPSWDLKTLYVLNDVGNSVTQINPRNGRPIRTIPVDDPYNMYFTPDGSYAIVVAERNARLDFRDPHTMRLHHSLNVPCRGVDHMDFSADGTYAVASCEFSGALLKVDLASERVARQMYLPVGSSPQDVKLSPDGRVFYVADMVRGGVWEIDGQRWVILGFLRTGLGAHGLYASRDARFLYVTNRREGSISLVSFRTRRVVRKWRIPGGGSPDMGNVSADGRVLWLSGRWSGVVYAIDTRTGRLLARIPVGAGPHGLCVWPQPGRYSLGHTGILR